GEALLDVERHRHRASPRPAAGGERTRGRIPYPSSRSDFGRGFGRGVGSAASMMRAAVRPAKRAAVMRTPMRSMVAPVSLPAVRPWKVEVTNRTKLAKWILRHTDFGMRAWRSEVIS